MLYLSMQGFIKFIRILSALLLSFILLITVILLPLVIGVYSAVGSPDNLKVWIDDSGIYENIVDIAIDEGIAKAGEGSIERGFAVSEDEARTSLKSILEPEWLKKNVETVLDGTYLWITGESETPDFTLDLGDRKDKVGEALRTLVHAKVEALEVCGPEVEITEGFDPFKANCLPVDVSQEEAFQIVDQKIDELISNEEFLKETKVHGSDLDIPTDVLKSVPQAFKIFITVMYTSIALLVLLPIVIILLMPKRIVGLVNVGVIFLVGGLINLFAALSSATSYAIVSKAITGRIEDGIQNSAQIQDIVFSILDNVLASLSKSLLIASVVFILVAVVSFVIAAVAKKASKA